jgi:hypothetical protein
VGANSNAVIANNGTISGAAVVYFIADQAAVTLPAATTVGQRLTLIDNAPSNSSSTFTIKAASGDTINDGANSVSGAATDSAPDTLNLVSDGLHHWWVMARG